MRKVLFILYRGLVRLATGSGIDRFPLIHRAHQLVQRFLNPKKVQAFGKTLYLDPGDTLNLSIIDMHEPEQVALFRNIVQEGDVVLDLGAHIGYYTLLFAQLVGPQGKVYAFEAHPDNAALLRKSIAESGYDNVVIENKAVWEKTGKFPLYEASHCSEDHRMSAAPDHSASITIDAVALDDYFPSDMHVDFIKMDIQGAEGHALKGMKDLLASQKQVSIVTEFEPECLDRSEVGTQAFLHLLTEQGFNCYDLEGDGGLKTPVQPETLCTQYAGKNERTNLFCTKSH